jgi:hypothetical protein
MSKTEKILYLKNEIEARLLDDVLTERNIPHILRSYHDSAYDGLFQYQSGWGHIEAPAEYRKEILEIYESLSSQ